MLTAPDKEIHATTNTLVVKTSTGGLAAIIFAVIVGLFISLLIAKPITALTEVIGKTAKFDFTPKTASYCCGTRMRSGRWQEKCGR